MSGKDVRDLPSTEIAALLLDAAWRVDQDAPDLDVRVVLADRLNCDKNLRAEA